MNKELTVYITKYCLTKGVEKRKVLQSINPDMVSDFKNKYECFYKGEYFLTFEEAFEDAYKRKEKRIKSLEKQLIKIKQLEF